MALLSVSRLTCGSWSLEWNIVLTLSLLTQHILYQLCQWVVQVSDQSCLFPEMTFNTDTPNSTTNESDN